MPLGEALDKTEAEAEALLFEAVTFELLEGTDPSELLRGHSATVVRYGESAGGIETDADGSALAGETAGIVHQFLDHHGEVGVIDAEGSAGGLLPQIIGAGEAPESGLDTGGDGFVDTVRGEQGINGAWFRRAVGFQQQQVVAEGAVELPPGDFDLADHLDDFGLVQFGEAEPEGFREAKDAVERGVEFVWKDRIEPVPQ